MPILDTTEFDFSQEHAREDGQVARRVAVVRNPDTRAVLHVGVRSSVPWLDVYPAEFALAPQEGQTVTVELRPERARNTALTPATVSVLGQYLTGGGRRGPARCRGRDRGRAAAGGLPELRRGAAGRRARVPPVRRAHPPVPRLRDAQHLDRPRLPPQPGPRAAGGDRLAPGAGRRRYARGRVELPLGVHLARRWSAPAYPVSRPEDVAEWSAPLAAFGMVLAAAIEPALARATIQAFELATDAALWEFDLPDARGLYPDRGAMAVPRTVSCTRRPWAGRSSP